MIYTVVFWGPEVLITCNSSQTWNMLDWKLNKEKQNEADKQKGVTGMQISATLQGSFWLLSLKPPAVLVTHTDTFFSDIHRSYRRAVKHVA